MTETVAAPRPPAAGAWAGVWLGLLLSCGALAATVPITPDTTHVLLGLELELLEDPTGTLTLADVLSESHRSKFEPSRNVVPSFGPFSDAVWFRFQLARDTAAGPFYLEVGYRGLESIDLYSPAKGGGVFHEHAGLAVPFSERNIQSRQSVLQLPPPAGDVDTYHLRISSLGPLIAPLILWSPESFHRHQNRERLLFGTFFGILMAMLAYNLVAVISLREGMHLWSALSIGMFGMALFAESGLALDYLWPSAPRWDQSALPFFFGLATATFIPFTRALLRTRIYTPRLDSMLLTLIGFALVVSTSALASLSSDFVNYRLVLTLAMVLGIATMLTALPAAWLCVRAGHRPARHLLAGLLILAGVGVVVELENSGWLERSGTTAAVVPAGVGLFLLTTTLGLAERVARIRREKDEAQYVAAHDLLTGIANRRYLDEMIIREWSRAQRSAQPLSLIMIDLDHFKSYNDAHGHLAGDACLRVVAETFTRTLLRPGDTVARFGGEEFAVVLPDTNKIGALLVAERLRSAVEELAIPSGHPGSTRALPALTVSLGCATTVPNGKQNPSELVVAADAALYRAKATGRNCAVSASLSEIPPATPGSYASARGIAAPPRATMGQERSVEQA